MSTDSFQGMAERLIAYLELCEERRPRRAPVQMAEFDGAVAVALNAEEARALELLIPFNDGAPAVWPIDLRAASPADDSFPAGAVQFNRFHTISTAEARRSYAAKLYGPRMLAWDVGVAMPNGDARTARSVAAQIGGRWRFAGATPLNDPGVDVGSIVPFTLGLALSLRYHWTVAIGIGDGPRIRFVTDPTGAREAFRFRDIPPGRARRAALRHWVTEHSRRRRNDPAASSWVHEHLRGATDFAWQGLRCRIEPAAYDLERLAAA